MRMDDLENGPVRPPPVPEDSSPIKAPPVSPFLAKITLKFCSPETFQGVC